MRPLIAANWKMHGSLDWAKKPAQFDEILPKSQRPNLDVLICAPALFSTALCKAAEGGGVYIGAQNCHAMDSGAHTGEISAKMLAEVGLTYVIVGHSERRATGETDMDVQQKASAALRSGITPIICVGESLEQREAGDALAIVSAQLKSSLPDEDGEVVVAYEPIWAIGTGKTPTTTDIAAMHDHIRALVGEGVRLLYGGSVKPANAKDILAVKNVNGALIGGASLEMESLAEITRAAL